MSKQEIPTHLLEFFKPQSIIKPKDEMGVPWALATALRDDGWFLRSDILWTKKNPMPESVTDRPTSAHEHIFLLTKSARYFWDQEAVREEGVEPDRVRNDRIGGANGHTVRHSAGGIMQGVTSRNLRNVWEIATQPFSGAHFAVFPMEIPRRCIKAGTSQYGACSACGAPWVRVVERSEQPKDRMSGKGWLDAPSERPDGYKPTGLAKSTMGVNATLGWQPGCACDADVMPCTVLDPFSGSGTTGLVADQLGRNAILIELNPAYARMAEQQIHGDAPMFARVEVAS